MTSPAANRGFRSRTREALPPIRAVDRTGYRSGSRAAPMTAIQRRSHERRTVGQNATQDSFRTRRDRLGSFGRVGCRHRIGLPLLLEGGAFLRYPSVSARLQDAEAARAPGGLCSGAVAKLPSRSLAARRNYRDAAPHSAACAPASMEDHDAAGDSYCTPWNRRGLLAAASATGRASPQQCTGFAQAAAPRRSPPDARGRKCVVC
jgi:hypothetical protein